MTLNTGQASALELRLAEIIEKHDTPESRAGSELVNSLFLLLQEGDEELKLLLILQNWLRSTFKILQKLTMLWQLLELMWL